MSSFFRFYKLHSGKILFFVLFFTSILYNIESTKYIYEVEREIEYRDSLLKRMTISDELVKRYFDISFDSIKNETFYSLKKEKLATITSTKYFVEDRPAKIIETTVIKEQGIDSLISSFDMLLHDYNQLVRWANNKADSLEKTKTALDLIKKNYDISYGIEREEGEMRLYLISEKADSAFLLLPYYRDKIQYDSENKCWLITRER